jgi:hypothetical protein
MNFYSATKKNEILLFASKWVKLENTILSKLARLRRPKIVCSPLSADYKPKTNAVMLLGMGHTLRGERAREI